jgi:hypothetical protein
MESPSGSIASGTFQLCANSGQFICYKCGQNYLLLTLFSLNIAAKNQLIDSITSAALVKNN